MKMQPSQLAPLYPFDLVGNVDGTISGVWQRSGDWGAQGQPSPYLFPVMMLPAHWFVTEEEDRCVDLAAYVEGVAGTAADLDPALEAAAIEFMLRDNQAEPQ